MTESNTEDRISVRVSLLSFVHVRNAGQPPSSKSIFELIFWLKSIDDDDLLHGPDTSITAKRSVVSFHGHVSLHHWRIQGGGANGRMPNALHKFAQWFFEEAKVCPMDFSSIRTCNVRVLHRSSRTSGSIQLNFPQPIARAFLPSAISTSHQIAFIFDFLRRSEYCKQARLSDGYSRYLLSDFLVHQLCMITGSKNVD